MDMTRENAYEVWSGGTLEECAENLLKYKEMGESVFVNFNGHKIYSCDITSVDYAYQEVFGMTKENYQKKLKEEIQRYEREKAEKKAKAIEKTKANMPKWIESLKEIKKSKPEERTFYEQILNVIKQMEGVVFTAETLEEFRTTLEEIGCVNYDDWKSRKKLLGQKIEDETIEEGINKANIGTAVTFISQFFSDYENANYGISRMLEGGDEYGWVQQWLKNSQTKVNIPYYQVAKQALMNWNGLSEEEANKVISKQSLYQIKSQVDVDRPMYFAMDGIAKYFSKKGLTISDIELDMLHSFIYYGYYSGQSKIADGLRSSAPFINGTSKSAKSAEFQLTEKDMDNLIIDTLFAVHDGWVEDNEKEFMSKDKKYKHMPSELIGWKETKADLLFVRPIFETLGIKVDEDRLHEIYNERVKDFFLDKGITSSKQLRDVITQGEKFYPAIQDYRKALTSIKDSDYVDKEIIPSIEQQGIGNIEETRRDIVSQIINNPKPKDVARLSDEEKEYVEQSLGQEVSTLAAQRDELHKKNSIVLRIIALAKRRKNIKEEIAIEEQKKSENLHGFDI